MEHGFSVLVRPPAKAGAGVPMYWTGVGWHSDLNEAVLFRVPGYAAEFARKRGWKVASDLRTDPPRYLRVEPVFPRVVGPIISFT